MPRVLAGDHVGLAERAAARAGSRLRGCRSASRRPASVRALSFRNRRVLGAHLATIGSAPGSPRAQPSQLPPRSLHQTRLQRTHDRDAPDAHPTRPAAPVHPLPRRAPAAPATRDEDTDRPAERRARPRGRGRDAGWQERDHGRQTGRSSPCSRWSPAGWCSRWCCSCSARTSSAPPRRRTSRACSTRRAIR